MRTHARRGHAGWRKPLSTIVKLAAAGMLVFAVASAEQSSSTTKITYAQADSFRESLTIRPLADGRVHTLFTFELTSPWHADNDEILPTYSFVPRSLIHVASASDADEVHLAMNAGRWNYDVWGIPSVEQMVGTGAEVRAVLRANDTSRESIELQPAWTKWRKLKAGLAGLFCASLDALDEKLTVTPFEDAQTSSSTTNTKQFHAMLSSESICTENLSTLLKLLPCKSMAGLASLLKPHSFFLADYHGLSLHLTRKEAAWHVKFNIQAVFSPHISPGLRLKRDWSFEKLFGTRLQQSCPLVDSSSVTVLAPPQQKGLRALTSSADADEKEQTVKYRVWPIVMHPIETKDIDENEDWTDTEKLIAKAKRFAYQLTQKGFFKFDTRYSTDLNVEMQWPEESAYVYPSSYDKQKISVSRILSGHGQERGTVELKIRNNDATQTRTVLYHEVLPWFVKPYIHTLSTSLVPDEYDEEEDNVVRYADDIKGPTIVDLRYTPSIPRKRPFHLEARLRIAPQSTLNVVFDYEKAFMRFAEHPPDAHRGFNVAPAVIELEDGSRLYSEPALVEVAVPDFSMPYNVIIFTSTLIALCAGSALNNLIRSYTDVLSTQDALDK